MAPGVMGASAELDAERWRASRRETLTDSPELAELVDAWNGLPGDIRAAIPTVVRAGRRAPG